MNRINSVFVKNIFTILLIGQCSIAFSQKAEKENLKRYNGFEIQSIDSDDFSDLKAIDSLVQNKRIILLGESQHGIEDFNILKYRIIRYLNTRHDFNVVAFESGIANCGFTNLVKDSLSGMEMLVRSLTGVWRVKGNCAMMDYIRNNKMDIAGFDPNGTSLGLTTDLYTQLFNDVEIAKRFAHADSLKLHGYHLIKGNWKFNNVPFNEAKMDSLRNALKTEYRNLMGEVLIATNISPKIKEVVKKAVESICLQLSTSSNKQNEDYFIDALVRDKLMAKNLEYLTDTLYKDKKIIVWAHNLHIARSHVPGFNGYSSIMEHVDARIRKESLIVGLFSVSGQYAWGNNKPQTFVPAKGSLEHKFSGFTSKALWVSSRNLGRKKIMQGIPGYKAVTSELFDALIFVKDTRASQLIPFKKDLSTCD